MALRQDVTLVTAILDYRTAQRAKELFNSPDKKAAFEQLSANPRLLEMLAMMSRAQRGQPLEGPQLDREGMVVASQYRSEDGDEGGAS